VEYADNQLFDAIINNNEQAIRQYHDDIIPPLCGFAYKWIYKDNKEAAADIATDAFCDTLKSGVKFDDLKHVTSYMYINAGFKCGEYNKKKKKMLPPNRPLEDVEYTLLDDQNLEDDVIRSEFFKAILMQINNLDREKDRKLLLLSLRSFKPVEIARQLGLDDEYVRTRIKDLAKKIRNELITKKIITFLFLLALQISNL
jgi:RNA polymerase sigma factor (sigma-70 family)